jgi:hypothetical protein
MVEKSQWIPVGERLPIVTDDMLQMSGFILATDGCEIDICYMMVEPDGEKPLWLIKNSDGRELKFVSHWMPLPELP